jgi:hypothetical protein
MSHARSRGGGQAARFGVSRTTDWSCAEPSPIKSPTTIDPDARLELSRFDIQPTDRVDQAEPRPDRPLGIVLMRSRVAEIDQHTIALPEPS